MRTKIDKEIFLTKLMLASKYISGKLNIAPALQGVYLDFNKDKLEIFATDLNTFFHTTVTVSDSQNFAAIIEPKKIIEFLNLLSVGEVEVIMDEQVITLSQGTSRGSFPTITSSGDYPKPPIVNESKSKLSKNFFSESLPRVLFTASKDDTRPVLTGVSFVVVDEEMVVVSTDGFRLSLLRETNTGIFPPMIIPASFIDQVVRESKESKAVLFAYSEKEKIVVFQVGDDEHFTRLIDGEFPPYEKVIPTEKKTTVKLKKDDLLRNTKLISIFAREFSNVVVYEFSKSGLALRPKKEGNKENTAKQDIEIEGEEQSVAFNYRYVLDFLNNTNSEEIIIEILRPDAPVVFSSPGDKKFVHIIMPVRIQE